MIGQNGHLNSWRVLLRHNKVWNMCKIFSHIPGLRDHSITKGQIFWKGPFDNLESPRNRTNEFISVVKMNLFVRFLGEFEDTKKSFRNWTSRGNRGSVERLQLGHVIKGRYRYSTLI